MGMRICSIGFACDDAFLVAVCGLHHARRNGAAEKVWDAKNFGGIGLGAGVGIAAIGSVPIYPRVYTFCSPSPSPKLCDTHSLASSRLIAVM